jgi:hypothetical protein
VQDNIEGLSEVQEQAHNMLLLIEFFTNKVSELKQVVERAPVPQKTILVLVQ